VAKPIQITVALRALFSINNSPQARWGSESSHPVRDATVEIEGTGLSATTGSTGDAKLDVSTLVSGNYVLALTPHKNNLLRNSSEPVNVSDGNTTDTAGTCRYRPLKIRVSFKLSAGSVKLEVLGPQDGVTHGAAFFRMPATLLIDWKPDWVACKHKGPRPKKSAPTMVLVHRTEGSTAGSALDTFIPSPRSITSHYLVDVDGHIIKLVHEDLVANHAGESWWAGTAGLKNASVGIEIVNAGKPFTQQQHDATIRIIRDLMTRYPGITRHNVLGHGEVRVVTQDGAARNLRLVERAGCPGVLFEWKHLEAAGLSSKADPSLFAESQIDAEYGGYFKDKPDGRIHFLTTDGKLLNKQKQPYGVIASLQADLSALGYSINASNGVSVTGEYDDATQAAVDRFRRRYMPGAVPDNMRLYPIFDRATAIALKRVLLDRKQ
jgi:N-acetyl-anhydromuramyl-L-alanine amidase AmpD